MSIADLYDSGEHKSNIAHFAAIVNLAAVDKAINSEEETVLKRLAFKLNVSEEKYRHILKNQLKFHTQKERLLSIIN